MNKKQFRYASLSCSWAIAAKRTSSLAPELVFLLRAPE